MKKVLVVLLCLTLVFAMAACSAQPAAESSAATSESAAQESKPAEATQQESKPAEESESAAAQTEMFDADYCEDSISGDQLEAKFGPIEDLDLDFENISMGVVVKTLANESWTSISQGVKDYVEPLGVTVDLQAPKSESDSVEQLAMTESMLSKGYDALLLAPQSNTTLDAAVKQANESGILVVNLFDAQINDAKSFVGNISIDTGRLAADYIAEFAGEKGQVACIEGLAGAYAAIQRTAGFKEGIAEYPDMEVVASTPADWDRQKAMDVATDLLNQYPDLVGIYCNNDTMALGAIEAVKEAGKLGKVAVVGSDGIEGAIDSIAAGDLTATVDLNLYVGGKLNGEVALRLLAGQDIPRVVEVPQLVLDINNYTEHVAAPAA